jgi:hypothetical protein
MICKDLKEIIPPGGIGEGGEIRDQGSVALLCRLVPLCAGEMEFCA